MAANGSKWQQLAANGSKWQQMTANGSNCKWQQIVANSSKTISCQQYRTKIQSHWKKNYEAPLRRTVKNHAPDQSFPTKRNYKFGTVAGCAAHWIFLYIYIYIICIACFCMVVALFLHDFYTVLAWFCMVLYCCIHVPTAAKTSKIARHCARLGDAPTRVLDPQDDCHVCQGCTSRGCPCSQSISN